MTIITNLAICDDDICISAQIEEYLNTYKYETFENFKVEVFLSGNDLYKNLIEGGYYDIIFLDIEMNLLNGIQLGTLIREEFDNEVTQIVYISSKDNYAMQLFKVRPLDFIIKPFIYDDIAKVLNNAMKIINTNQKVFHYTKGQAEYKILIRDILYFESHGRKIIVNMVDNSDVFYDTLSNISEKLPYFISIHKSYLININYIKKIEYDCIEMTNGVVLPISQANRKKVRDMVMELKRKNNNL